MFFEDLEEFAEDQATLEDVQAYYDAHPTVDVSEMATVFGLDEEEVWDMVVG